MLSLTQLLYEIGDSSPYPFTQKDIDLDGVSLFYFKTDSGLTYQLSISHEKIILGVENININFEVIGDNEFKMTNKFETLRIMATVQKAVKFILNKIPEVKCIYFSAKAENSEKENGKNRRKDLYLYYIKKYWPNAKISSSDDGEVIATIK